MRTTLVRRASAAALTLSLTLGLTLGLTLAGPAAQAATIPAPGGADPTPVELAGSYLAAQPGPDGIIKTFYIFPADTPPQSFDDYGVTIDAVSALDAVGGHDADVARMTDALEDNIPNYVFGGGTAAKLLSLLLAQGRVGADEDGVLDTLEDHIATSDPIKGRLVDPDPDDYNTPLTQAYAVNALNNASSDLANSALAFLLEQQCSAGFFRGSFADKAASDQTCDGAATPADNPDTTALAVLMLQDQKSKPVVRASISSAVAWLASQQAADGSFNGANANTTGLAGWALGVSGRTEAATKAARWLRGQQLVNAGGCTKYAAKDNGAVTLDALGLANAAAGPMDEVDNSVAARATTQALPALLWASGGTAAGATTLTGPGGFVRAGSAQAVTLTGAPGNTVCVSTGGAGTRVVLDATGKGTTPVAVPSTTGKVTVTAVDGGGETDTLTFTALAAAKLTVKARSSVHRGAAVRVRVKGLEAGEQVTVRAGGKVLEETANARGKVKVTVRAAKVGKLKVKVVGAFANRKGRTTVRVLR